VAEIFNGLAMLEDEHHGHAVTPGPVLTGMPS
jgi:hypothetical protein